MARHGQLPERLGEPIWDSPIGGQMGSAGFLIVFAAVNLAAVRLVGDTRTRVALSLAGAVACAGSLAALIAYTATHDPAQLGVLGGLLGCVRRGLTVAQSRAP